MAVAAPRRDAIEAVPRPPSSLPRRLLRRLSTGHLIVMRRTISAVGCGSEHDRPYEQVHVLSTCAPCAIAGLDVSMPWVGWLAAWTRCCYSGYEHPIGDARSGTLEGPASQALRPRL
jgi:hypothetical protein